MHCGKIEDKVEILLDSRNSHCVECTHMKSGALFKCGHIQYCMNKGCSKSIEQFKKCQQCSKDVIQIFRVYNNWNKDFKFKLLKFSYFYISTYILFET